MILDAGYGFASIPCTGCNKTHHNISIGEETVICVCGDVLTHRSEKDAVVYECFPREGLARDWEEAINSDTRNLC